MMVIILIHLPEELSHLIFQCLTFYLHRWILPSFFPSPAPLPHVAPTAAVIIGSTSSTLLLLRRRYHQSRWRARGAPVTARATAGHPAA